MSDIKNKLIKIAYENPELRAELLPVIMKVADATVHSLNPLNLKKLQTEAGELARSLQAILNNGDPEVLNSQEGHYTLGESLSGVIIGGLEGFSGAYRFEDSESSAPEAVNSKYVKELTQGKDMGPDFSNWLEKYSDWCRRVTVLPQFQHHKNAL